ncbi:MAG: protein-glutamate O-methyltransferase CheR [bacterium]|nr:protein-glutamate O-methyltransferase CheR [bacterium]
MNLLSEVRDMTDAEYRLLNEFVSNLYGISFPNERRRLLESRLKPRLQALDMNRFMDYYLLLQYAFEDEVTTFTRLITNNESYFFRETRQFDALLKQAWPDLVKGVTNGSPVRILCAGCSSGEEPYTLRIFSETHRLTPELPLQIDGLDIDADRLAAARKAEYTQTSLRATSEPQIRRFFSRTGSDHYMLNRALLEDTKFSLGNILDLRTFPTAGGYDVLFCRNVLIYFSERALHRAIDNFASVLRPGGLLFLGHAESIIGLSDAFETVRFDRCIAYRRRP